MGLINWLKVLLRHPSWLIIYFIFSWSFLLFEPFSYYFFDNFQISLKRLAYNSQVYNHEDHRILSAFLAARDGDGIPYSEGMDRRTRLVEDKIRAWPSTCSIGLPHILSKFPNWSIRSRTMISSTNTLLEVLCIVREIDTNLREWVSRVSRIRVQIETVPVSIFGLSRLCPRTFQWDK